MFLVHHLGTVIPMLEAVFDVVPVEKLAVHFHDTYGQALSNILLSLQVSYLLWLVLEFLRDNWIFFSSVDPYSLKRTVFLSGIQLIDFFS